MSREPSEAFIIFSNDTNVHQPPYQRTTTLLSTFNQTSKHLLNRQHHHHLVYAFLLLIPSIQTQNYQQWPPLHFSDVVSSSPQPKDLPQELFNPLLFVLHPHQQLLQPPPHFTRIIPPTTPNLDSPSSPQPH